MSKDPIKKTSQKIDLFFRLALILIVCGFILIGYFGFKVFKNRYQENSSSQSPEKISEKNKASFENYSSDDKDAGPDLTEEQLNENDVEPEEASDEFLEITTEDCGDKCTAYLNEENDLQYCRQVCGLTDRTENLNDNCEKLSGLKKDYCLKDLAIEKKDFTICEKITDKNLSKTCQNRLWEDVLENSPEI